MLVYATAVVDAGEQIDCLNGLSEHHRTEARSKDRLPAVRFRWRRRQVFGYWIAEVGFPARRSLQLAAECSHLLFPRLAVAVGGDKIPSDAVERREGEFGLKGRHALIDPIQDFADLMNPSRPSAGMDDNALSHKGGLRSRTFGEAPPPKLIWLRTNDDQRRPWLPNRERFHCRSGGVFGHQNTPLPVAGPLRRSRPRRYACQCAQAKQRRFVDNRGKINMTTRKRATPRKTKAHQALSDANPKGARAKAADLMPGTEVINIQSALAEAYSDAPVFARFDIWLVGETPLITNAWSEKAKNQMLAKQLKTTKAGRGERDPEADFVNSLYEMEPGAYGFPALGIKNAILQAAHKDKGVPRTTMLSALWIDADMVSVRPALAGAMCDMPLVRIYGDPPKMREDMVRVGSGVSKTATLAYRGQFTRWAIRVAGKLNTSIVTPGQFAAMIQDAGMSCGIGEWRNERHGVFGSFHLAHAAEQEAWELFAAGKGPIPEPINFDPTIDLAAHTEQGQIESKAG